MPSWCLGGALKRGKRVSPKAIEVAPKRGDALGIDGIKPPVPVLLRHNQPCLFEDAEVLRNRGTAHRKVAGQLADGDRPVYEALEDGASSRITQRVELPILVSNH
jgi:hypothetical protein